MKKLMLLAFGCLIALPTLVYSQDSVYHAFFLKQPVYRPGEVIPAKDVNQLVDVEIPAGKTYKLVEVIFDSTWSITDYNNTSSAITYSAGWSLSTGLTKFFNSDYHAGSTPLQPRTATYTVTCDKPCRIGFYSERFLERWAPHGVYTVKVDAGSPVTINAGAGVQGSDKDRDKPSFTSAVLPVGLHTVTISTSAQMVVDNFRLSRLKLVPRP